MITEEMIKFFKTLKVGDTVKIKTRKQFKKEGFKFDYFGNPIVEISWDDQLEMQEFMGKKLIIEYIHHIEIKAKGWYWSYDCLQLPNSDQDIELKHNDSDFKFTLGKENP